MIEKNYTETEVAEMLHYVTGDTCPCDFNKVDEWLPRFCKIDTCPCPEDVLGCWKEFIRNFKEGRETNADMYETWEEEA